MITKSTKRPIHRSSAAYGVALVPSLTGYGDKAHPLGPEVGLDTHVGIVGSIVEQDLTDVVLVGHSYAGMVISSAANQVLIDLATKSDSGWRVPPLPEMPRPFGLFGVTDPADVAWLRSMLSDHPVRCLQQPVRLDNPDVHKIPRTQIHCTVGPDGFERRPVPAVQPNGSPAQVWELATGHDCMITMPAELAELLLKLG
ncbi:putative esterase [Kribbella flavida DSM 17836]|uniref:Putative esterase n=1 Tax=Kribbella flavida (strain DSM 17836 / JCM 10339 / NBRC 14399) TaxID=479435 RepID=D2PSC7_KRIFD|nr:putative esterase [Kribbella flavida DSM 17836]